MNKSQGKLIVVEGTDGSGKSVQTKLLVEKLNKEGFLVATISFPQYGKKSAGLVEEYLNGKYGKPDEVSPYAASLFYALDRFDFTRKIRAKLNEGYIFVTDRYVDSNTGHQGGKIKNPREREKFIKWLYDLEYRILEIPKPDLVIVLHVPAEVGQKLVAQKQQRLYLKGGKTRDAHEKDLEHLKNAEKSYLWLAKKFPRDHKIVECIKRKQLLAPEEIHEMVWKTISPRL